MNKGLKFDKDKVDLSLIPYEVLEEISRVLMFGAKKYGKYNWEKGIDYTRLSSAADRHKGIFMDFNKTIDREEDCNGCKKNKCKEHSQRHHIAASIVNLIFLLSFELNNRKEFDNRRKRIVNK